MNKLLIVLVFILSCSVCFAEIVQDEIADKLYKYVEKPETYTNYNFESTDCVPVKLRITENINSENEVYEGKKVEFKILKDVIYNRKVIVKHGTIVPAKVNLILTSGMNGIPACIIFDEFKIDGITFGQLSNNYAIYGQDRSLLVFPLKWALTILPPTGSLTNFIKGGHARLKTNKTITLYYHPKWL